MPLTFPKWLLSTQNSVAPRDKLSRVGDRFELDLREVIKGLPYAVQSNMVLSDFVALTIKPGEPRSELIREVRKKLDFAIVTQRSAFPVVAIMLTDRVYGRDRRSPPAVATDVEVRSNVIVTVLHINPKTVVGPAMILDVLKPYL